MRWPADSLEITQHKKTNRRRKIATDTIVIDLLNQDWSGNISFARYLPQRFPKLIFQADGRLVTGKVDGALDYG